MICEKENNELGIKELYEFEHSVVYTKFLIKCLNGFEKEIYKKENFDDPKKLINLFKIMYTTLLSEQKAVTILLEDSKEGDYFKKKLSQIKKELDEEGKL